MKSIARKIALKALIKIEKDEAYSNLVLNEVLRKHAQLDHRDRALVTELVYGTVQQLRLLDFYLQPFLKQKIGKLDRWLRQLLRMSVYQLLFLDRVPQRAVVHEAVNLAGEFSHRGLKGLVNGVLRNVIRFPKRSVQEIEDPVERLAVQTSHPSWMVKRWVKQYGLDVIRQVCTANNEPPRSSVRVNPLKANREDIKTRLEEEGFQVQYSSLTPAGLIIEGNGNISHSSLFREGYVTIQDESSMLVAPLLDVKPNMRVLDVCAAPGGKTSHMAEIMENKGEIVANDFHQHKEKLIQQTMSRLGINIVHTSVEDARILSATLNGSFDRILVDAPCSGFGVIRRKPDLKWNKKPEDIADIAHMQYEILHSVSSLLKKGGFLVYSTCTFDQAENKDVIHTFIKAHPQFFQIEAETRQILPHEYQSDGFYMTKLRKK